MKKTKKLLAVLLAMALALGLLPAAAMAACDPKVTITFITPPSSDVYQWQSGYSVGFGFEISCDTGTTLEAGQTASVGTNIGELFSWEGSMSGLRVEQDGKLLCTVDITANTVTFNFAEGSEGAMEIEGRLFTTALTADDVGAEDGSDVTKTLQIGEKEAEIVFKFKSPDPPSSSSIGTVDVDTSWKNAWSCDSYTGAEVQIEVNPIGSLDLYGSTTVEGRKPHTHGQLFIKDEIPEHGFIDQARIQIYASVPTLAESTIDYVDKWHGNYSIPQGAYYAQREGTLRYSLTDAGRMTRIEQNDGETIKEFEARIKEKDLQWGIYYDEATNTETFMCNFGDVGDPNDNNGVTYDSLGGRGAEYAAKYPDIFGDKGATGGNVVHYFVHFYTYYPDVIGSKNVTNTLVRTSYMDGADWLTQGGNGSTFTVNNGGGTGVARKNQLIISLVNADDRLENISGAQFHVEKQNDDGDWETVAGMSGETGEDGCVVFRGFTPGRYKVVQDTWAEGYVETANIFADPGNTLVNAVGDGGVFEVTGDEKFGFGALVLNWKDSDKDPVITLTPQSMTAYTGGNSLSGTPFPAVRYEISGADPEMLTFSVDEGETFNAAKAGSYWVLAGLGNTFTPEGGGTAAAHDGVPGVYAIGVDTAGLTITGSEGTVYGAVIGSGGSLTVRNVSAPDAVLDEAEPLDIAQPVVAVPEDVDTADGIGVAVIADKTSYYTNGKEALGVLGDDEAAGAQISMLFDDILPGEEGEDTEQLLISHAGEKSFEFSSDNSEFKYLDLINENDGNAWVSTDDGAGISIYWPLPEELELGAEYYDFYVLHFKGLHREYRDDIAEQIGGSEVEPIEVTADGENMVFTLEGNKAGGCFSPFALVWEKKLAYTVTFEPGAGGTLAGAAADGRVQIANILPDSKLAHGDIPAVNENAGWRFTDKWTDESGKEYTADDILALEIDQDYTFTAQYESAVVPAPLLTVTKSANVEGAAVGDEVVYTITVMNSGNVGLTGVTVTEGFSGHGALRFEVPDGVTDNGDGTFTIGELAAGESVKITAKYTVLEEDAGTTLRNTVVANSTETGPNETTETVDVPEAEEPDEPWWPPIIPPDDDDDDDDEPVRPGSTVPPMLNGKDHFAYVIGYEDGTVKPEGTITRAEVATIVFRLLKPEVRDGNLTTVNSFADVDESDWYNMAVSTLVKLGIITGRTESISTPTRR